MIPVLAAYATGGERLLCMNGTDGAISGWDCFGMTIGSANAVDFKFDGTKRFFFDYGGDGANIVTMAAPNTSDELKFKTLGSKPIYFDTSNNGTDLYIKSSGEVGIGTTNPSDILHVAGSGTGAGIARLRVSSTDNQAGILLLSDNTGDVIIYSPNATNDLRFYAGGQDRMTILSGGNVGIGTESSGRKLHSITSASGYPHKTAKQFY